MKIKRLLLYFLILGSASFCACDKNPTNKLLNPVNTVSTSAWSNPIIIYNGEINTGHESLLTNGSGQTITVSSYSNPAPGFTKCLQFSWDGSPVTVYSNGTTTNQWAGFGFSVADPNNSKSAQSTDITPGNYTKLHFSIRGNLNANVAFRVEFTQTNSAGATVFDNIWQTGQNNNSVTSSWQSYDLAISGSQANNLTYYCVLTFQVVPASSTNPLTTNGGTVYFDDIRLTQ